MFAIVMMIRNGRSDCVRMLAGCGNCRNWLDWMWWIDAQARGTVAGVRTRLAVLGGRLGL